MEKFRVITGTIAFSRRRSSLDLSRGDHLLSRGDCLLGQFCAGPNEPRQLDWVGWAWLPKSTFKGLQAYFLHLLSNFLIIKLCRRPAKSSIHGSSLITHRPDRVSIVAPFIFFEKIALMQSNFSNKQYAMTQTKINNSQ